MKTKYLGLLCAALPLFLVTSCIELTYYAINIPYRAISYTLPSVQLVGAIGQGNITKVTSMLDNGFSPDRGAASLFQQRNPLDVAIDEAAGARRSAFWEEDEPGINPPRIEIIKLLVERGADINRMPYIWNLVDFRARKFYLDYYYTFFDDPVFFDEALTNGYEEKFQWQRRDSNGILKLLLDMGFDPEKRRNRYSVYGSYSKKRAEDDARNGSRPLNEAIQMGMIGESKVDLLLQYGCSLDEESLWAAWNSYDPGMLEKIEKLWAENEGR